MATVVSTRMEGNDLVRLVIDVESAQKAAKVVAVPKGSTGTIIEAEFRRDGVAVDYSAAAGPLLFHARTPEGAAVTTDGVATWTVAGADGKIRHTLSAGEAGTVRELHCEFEIQGWNGGNLVQPMFILKIAERARV